MGRASTRVGEKCSNTKSKTKKNNKKENVLVERASTLKVGEKYSNTTKRKTIVSWRDSGPTPKPKTKTQKEKSWWEGYQRELETEFFNTKKKTKRKDVGGKGINLGSWTEVLQHNQEKKYQMLERKCSNTWKVKKSAPTQPRKKYRELKRKFSNTWKLERMCFDTTKKKMRIEENYSNNWGLKRSFSIQHQWQQKNWRLKKSVFQHNNNDKKKEARVYNF